MRLTQENQQKGKKSVVVVMEDLEGTRDWGKDGRAELLTFTVATATGFEGTGQLWLEVDLLGDAPLDDGRDRRPR